MSALHYCIHKTPIGELLVAESDGALVRVAFSRENFDVVLSDLSDAHAIEAEVASVALHVAARQLDEYFRGERASFDVPLGADPETPLKRAVRETLLSSEPGEVMTYKELAEASGFPSAIRAAASACASNPLPIVVPCHRVVRSDGSPGQYLGGADVKRFLLDLEAQASA